MSKQPSLHAIHADAGAVFVDHHGWSVPADFGDPAAEYQAACEKSALFDLSPRSKVEMTGADAISFLQNFCTNDVKALEPRAGCEAFITTAKGRLVAHVFISNLSTDQGGIALWLDSSPGLAESICQHLGRYKITEQVELKDRTEELVQLHVCGPTALTSVHQVFGQEVTNLAPLQALAFFEKNTGAVILRRHDALNLPGVDIFCHAESAPRLWPSLIAAGAVRAGMSAFEILRIEAGVPEYGLDMDEDRFVMEIGRSDHAISFTKGCYLGQESILMARDRGHVNRQLMGLRLAGDSPIERGAKVMHDGAEVGAVTSSVYSPRKGAAIGLAYLKRGFQTPGTKVEIIADDKTAEAEITSVPFV